MLLQAYGHRAATVHTGKDALEVITTEPPDVILLDIGLPHMNGWDVARQIRTEPRGKKPLLIAVTKSWICFWWPTYEMADGSLAPEPTFGAEHVAEAVLYMAGLPLDANVQFLTITATTMPFIGRG